MNTTHITVKKEIVVSFLRQCNAYSDRMIDSYRTRIAEGEDIQELCKKAAKWSAYREFNQRAIDELTAGELDDWFTDGRQAS
jgi:hypothetical protein